MRFAPDLTSIDMADLAQEEKQQRAADEGTGATANLGCAKNLKSVQSFQLRDVCFPLA